MKEKTNCLICKNETKFGGKTCSRKCADELKKINSREKRNCLFCKKEFTVRKKDAKQLCSEECRWKWADLPENIENRTSAAKNVLMKKYGVDSPSKLQGHVDKIKKTKLQNHGDENYVNFEKAKQTKKEIYGDENYNNLIKSNQTKLDNHGDENYNNREQAKKTMIEKYGVEHALRLDMFKLKQQETCFKNNGVMFPLQCKKIINKSFKTNLEKYGVEHVLQNKDIFNKTIWKYQSYISRFI